MTLVHTAPATALDEDGDPVWSFADGAPLVPGVRALERLGVGGRCEVWRGWDERLWAPVVVKLPRPHQVEHPRARASLGREVAALDGVLHPRLPRLYRHDLDAALPHLVEEHVDGPDLEDLLRRRRTSARGVTLLGVQLLSALLPLHAHGVAHLDVKPANVVLRDGCAVLVDLGSSRPLGRRQPAGRPVGTAGWTSPEMEACAPVNAAMDVYGVGAVLHEAWRRRVPSWRRTALPDVLARLTAEDPADRPSARTGLALLSACLPSGELSWPNPEERTIST